MAGASAFSIAPVDSLEIEPYSAPSDTPFEVYDVGYWEELEG